MRRGVVVTVLAVSVLSLGALWVWDTLRAVPVEAVHPTRGRVVEAVYATARVDCDERATVRARRPGPLVALTVGPGQVVEKDAVVAVQEDSDAVLEIARLENELSAARADLAEANDAFARGEKLYQAGLLPENQLIALRERAQASQKRAEAVAQAVASARLQRQWATLKSPLAGAVTEIRRRTGDVLREGDEVLTVVNLERAYLRAAVDERDLGAVRPGQRVRIVFDAYPDRPLEGTVWRIIPEVDRLTRAADVLISLPPDTPPLQLNLTATVNIVIREVADALLVPRSAVLGEGEGRRVLVVGPGGRAEERKVELGLCDLESCQVLSGLDEDDWVIRSPETLKPGRRVRLP